MPLFGAHMSVAGGLTNAISTSVALGCETLQIFTKSPNSWASKPRADRESTAFRKAVGDAGLKFVTAHDSYLINLASPDDTLFRKSLSAFTDELDRAEDLALDYLVTHPGAHTGSGVTAGLARVVSGLDQALSRCRGYHVCVLLETTAGQGTCLGGQFEHLRSVLDQVKEPDRLGVCLDTCHVFAAGYDLRTPDQYSETFGFFDRVIGLDRLKLFHLNDSLGQYASCVDRHAAIGRGNIGPDPFRWLVTDPRFAAHPMILETPKEDEHGNAMDAVNLAILRGYLGQ